MKGNHAMFKRAVHPGDILKDELEELGVTPTEFARQIDVPPNRISQILSGKRSITGDTALRFGHWFGTDPQFWLNLQAQYDLVVADRQTGEAIRHLPTRSSLPASRLVDN
jgi:antitoxin HigA-1